MNIIKRFIKKFFNVFLVLLLFLTLNVTPIKAESDYTENDIFYSIGSFINSTMDGISTRLNEIEIINLGKNYAKSLIDNGSRMSDIVRVRGNEFLFNPHGKTGIGNAIDSVYGAYNDFANYAVSKVEDDRYVVNINKTYTFNYGDSADNTKAGFMVVWGNPEDVLPLNQLDYHHVNAERISGYNYATLYGKSNTEYRLVHKTDRVLGRLHDSVWSGSSQRLSNGILTFPLYETNLGIGATVAYREVDKSRTIVSNHFERIVFHNTSEYDDKEDIVPYNSDDIPTKEDFVSKIEGTYEPGKFYTYNFEEVLNENTVINNHYVTNNYITTEEVDDDVDYIVGDSKDYTSLLDKILTAIKDLPKNIADKLDFPEGSGEEEGGGFWSGLFGAIGDLATSMSDLVTGLPDAIISLLDGILGLVEKVVELFVPTAEQVEELKGSLDMLVGDLTGKFDFVFEPVDEIKNVFSKPQSIYDLKIEYDGQEFYVVPHFLKSSLDKLKVLLNGSVVLFTFISIYKRFVGREDVIK